MKFRVKKFLVVVRRNKFKIGLLLLIPFIVAISFVRIMDKTEKRRRDKIEYLVVHWTANPSPGADAVANAKYLRNKEGAGAHYCIDDKQIVQCTDEENVAYSVGGPKWFGFVPKFWLKDRIKNNNSLSFEMCLGGDRNDSIIIDQTAQLIGHRLVRYGLDMSRVVRHYDVVGKPCPMFAYKNGKWDRRTEDSCFLVFKGIVNYYYNVNLLRKTIWKDTGQWIDTLPPNIGKSVASFRVGR